MPSWSASSHSFSWWTVRTCFNLPACRRQGEDPRNLAQTDTKSPRAHQGLGETCAENRLSDAAAAGGRPCLNPQIRSVRHASVPVALFTMVASPINE